MGVLDFPEGPPEELVAWRKPIFAGAGHDYNRQPAILCADLVTNRRSAFRLTLW